MHGEHNLGFYEQTGEVRGCDGKQREQSQGKEPAPCARPYCPYLDKKPPVHTK